METLGRDYPGLLGRYRRDSARCPSSIAKPNIRRWRDHIIELDREKPFWKPSAVKVDDQLRVYVIDAGRYRMHVNRKKFRALQPGQVEPSA